MCTRRRNGEDLRSRVCEELQPFIDATPTGRDDFTGRLTGGTGALVARSEVSRELVMHPTITGLANDFLGPYTDKIQLHLTQIINIQPGQGTQPRHRDRLAWGGYLPPEIEPQFNTFWALTDFTEENGATRVVPGSVGWPMIANQRMRKQSKLQCPPDRYFCTQVQ
ncbi:MAG: hypothetical protein Ct9H300mP26_0060 [Acidimicrobiales bacterium]|nr:MAG: hypothetical protein Ct9H300mP26_0060 [Acidimicrobiales bacterium]